MSCSDGRFGWLWIPIFSRKTSSISYITDTIAFDKNGISTITTFALIFYNDRLLLACSGGNRTVYKFFGTNFLFILIWRLLLVAYLSLIMPCGIVMAILSIFSLGQPRDKIKLILWAPMNLLYILLYIYKVRKSIFHKISSTGTSALNRFRLILLHAQLPYHNCIYIVIVSRTLLFFPFQQWKVTSSGLNFSVSSSPLVLSLLRWLLTNIFSRFGICGNFSFRIV